MEEKIAEVSSLPQTGAKLCKTESGDEIAVFRLHDGSIAALANSCPHQGGPLAEGDLDEEGYITCPWHGWSFHCKTGACENMPGEDAKCYDLKVIGNDIFITVEDSNG